jgi:mRNA interferase MazF
MPTFRRGDVVKVPFPFTDRATRQRRPAVVVSGRELEAKHGLLWVVMITSAENRRWSDDLPIEDIGAAGLSVPSVIRTAKIATLDERDAERIGRIATPVRAQVAAQLTKQVSPVGAR